MSFTVRLEPGGQSFRVEPGQTVLEAAERHGVRLRYGCRHGNCSACKYELLDGDVDFGRASVYSLPDSERDDGLALLCCASPLGDLVVADDAPPDPRARPMILPAEHEATVVSVAPIAGDLWDLRVTRPSDLEFYAGQFVELGVPPAAGGPSLGAACDWRAFSVASPPEESETLRFVVKANPGGAFAGTLDPSAAGRPQPVRGPFGDAYLRDGDGPVLAVATGSGIAPVLSILGHAAATGDRRPYRCFYGTRARPPAAIVDTLEAAGASIDLELVACVSQPTGACAWDGFVGRVTPAIQRQVGDASDADAYVCGHPEMCQSVVRLLEAKGVREASLFADEFHPAVGAGVAAGR